MSRRLRPFIDYPLDMRRIRACQSAAALHDCLDPSPRAEFPQRGFPILVTDREHFLDMRPNRRRRRAQGHGLEPLRPSHGERDAEDPAHRFADVMHLLDPQHIEETLHVVEQVVDRPLVMRPWIRRLPMAAHVAADYPIMTRQRRHPVVPEARTAPEAVLD